eukprot:Hpha_TRINITY_DN11019_c0_g1::TRINITY_DN11019_c0_g1_i1::g.92818::m.92818
MALPVGGIGSGVNWLKEHLKQVDAAVEKEEKLEKIARKLMDKKKPALPKVKKEKKKKRQDSESLDEDERPRQWTREHMMKAVGLEGDDQDAAWGSGGGFAAKKPWEMEKASLGKPIEEEDPRDAARRKMKQEIRLQQLAKEKAERDRMDRVSRGPRAFQHKSWCNQKCEGRCDPTSWNKFCRSAPSAMRHMGEARAEKRGAETMLDDLAKKAAAGLSGKPAKVARTADTDEAEC